MSVDILTTIRLPLPLRRYARGAAEVTVRGATVGAVLYRLRARHDELGRMLFREDGELRGCLNVFVGSRNILGEQGLDTPLDPSLSPRRDSVPPPPLEPPLEPGTAVITIVPSVVGGRSAT